MLKHFGTHKLIIAIAAAFQSAKTMIPEKMEKCKFKNLSPLYYAEPKIQLQGVH